MKADVPNHETAAIARAKSLTTARTHYSKLIKAYDKIMDNYLDTMTTASLGLVLQSKIPLTTKIHAEKVFDETNQDSKYKMLVLETYLLSIEDVQSGNEVVKRAICNLPEHKVQVLRDWCWDNFSSPYPTDKQKEAWSRELEISVLQISQWFSNYRKRVWKPYRSSKNMPDLSGTVVKRPCPKGGDCGSKPHQNPSKKVLRELKN